MILHTQLSPPAKPSLRELLASLPLTSAVLFAVIIALHALRAVLPLLAPVSWSCLAWPAVMEGPHRLLTSVLFHLDLSHVTLNSLAMLSLLPPLEEAIGSVGLLALTLVLGASSQALYLLVEGLFYNVRQCAIGFSGVLFGLWVYSATRYNVGKLDLYPGVQISSALIPWMAIVFVQVALPHSSFLGHVCGALAGLASTRWTPSFAKLDALPLGPRFKPCPLPPPTTALSEGYRLGSV